MSSQHLCGQGVGLLTDSLHHARLPGVRLHWNHVLEAVQRDDALLGVPHLKDVLHFGAQFLPHGSKRSSYYRCFTQLTELIGAIRLTLDILSPRWYSKASYRWL